MEQSGEGRKWEYLFIDVDGFLAHFYQNDLTAAAASLKEKSEKENPGLYCLSET